MKRHKHTGNGKYELKTVRFIPTHAQHEKAEGKKYERMEHKSPSYASLKVPKTESFVSCEQEEMRKELEKTNKVTGLWYPHKAK